MRAWLERERWALIALPIVAVVFAALVWWISIRPSPVIDRGETVAAGHSFELSGLKYDDLSADFVDPPPAFAIEDTRVLRLEVTTEPVSDSPYFSCWITLEELTGEQRTFTPSTRDHGFDESSDARFGCLGAYEAATSAVFFLLPADSEGPYEVRISSVLDDAVVVRLDP